MLPDDKPELRERLENLHIDVLEYYDTKPEMRTELLKSVSFSHGIAGKCDDKDEFLRERTEKRNRKKETERPLHVVFQKGRMIMPYNKYIKIRNKSAGTNSNAGIRSVNRYDDNDEKTLHFSDEERDRMGDSESAQASIQNLDEYAENEAKTITTP